jgi:uncharacterized protein (DUF2225 family)
LKEEAKDVTIQIKYKNIQETISGNVEEVWLSINKLFSEFIPTFDTANKLMLKVDLHKLTTNCEHMIAFSKEGPSILVPRTRLTDNETLSLWLLANYVGYQLGILKNDALSKDELQSKLGKSGKIAGTRLGELVKNGTAARTSNDEYRITTFGITQIQKDTLPRIKAKIGT